MQKNTTREWAVKQPNLYRVVMHDDDFTPMDFAVNILECFFHAHRQQAVGTILRKRQEGQAECGIYTKEIAETKIFNVLAFARKNEHPLICSMEVAI